MATATDCLVIGGGISGLVSALELAKKDHSVILLEASARLGGSISSVELLGHRVDSGAESFAVTRSDALQLIEELGLHAKIIEPTRSDARIMFSNKLYPIPHGLMGIPSDLNDPHVIAILGTEGAQIARELDSHSWNISDEKSLGEVVEKRMGAAVVEKIVNPIVAGVHASDSYLLEIDSVLPGLLALAQQLGSLHLAVRQMRASSGRPGSAVSGIVGGVYQLISVLEQRLLGLGVDIKKNTPVISVSYSNADKKWISRTEQEEFRSESLVVAVPAHKAAQILHNFSDLSKSLSQIRAVDVAVVILAVQAEGLSEQPLGSGVLIANEGAGVAAKAATHASAKWKWVKDRFGDDVEIIRLSYGRNGILPTDLSVLKDWARQDLPIIYGLHGFKILDSKVVAWPHSLIQMGVGHRENLAQIASFLTALKGLVLVGAGLGGNGITGIVKKTKEEINLLEMESADHE